MSKSKRKNPLSEDEKKVTLKIKASIEEGSTVRKACSLNNMSPQTYYRNINYMEIEKIKKNLPNSEGLKSHVILKLDNITGADKQEFLNNIGRLIPDDAQDLVLEITPKYTYLKWAKVEEKIPEKQLEKIAWKVLEEQTKQNQQKKKEKKDYDLYLSLKERYEDQV